MNSYNSNTIQKVGQIGIPVQDISRATSFYKEILELPLLFDTATMAFFECNGLRLMLSLPEKEAFAHASSVIYFQVNDIHSYYSMLLNKHVTFVDQPHVVAKLGSTETWMTFFHDTEGNTLALMSEYDNR